VKAKRSYCSKKRKNSCARWELSKRNRLKKNTDSKSRGERRRKIKDFRICSKSRFQLKTKSKTSGPYKL